MAVRWLQVREDMQSPPNTVMGYAYDLNDFFQYCADCTISPTRVITGDFARYVRHMSQSRADACNNKRNRKTEIGLSRATKRRRASTIRQFYDFLVAEGLCQRNPTTGQKIRGTTDLPFVPNGHQWERITIAASKCCLRDRAMFALQYDAGLRKEELCSVWLSDFDHAMNVVRVRAETTKSKRTRIVPYSSITNQLLISYLQTLPLSVGDEESIFRSQSPRNFGQPVTVHAWTKVIDRIATDAKVRAFHSHTLRHLCLTDLARSGWDVLQIRDFAGHRSIKTTELYIQLSARDLKDKFNATLTSIHAQRTNLLGLVLGATKS